MSRAAAHPWSLPELHRRLALACRQRLAPATPDETPTPAEVLELEQQFLRQECRYAEGRAALAPADRDGFRAWFEDLWRTGPGQEDPLFDFLAREASLTQMRWFLAEESAGAVAFEDLVSLTLVRLPREAKIEMIRSSQDEMGSLRRDGVEIPRPHAEPTWETLAVSNLVTGFALDRRFAYHSVGALGVVELTTPAQRAMVTAGLTRLGVDASARHYHGLHPAIDEAHSRSWNEHVIDPLVEKDRRTARWIAEGAIARLNAGKRWFDRCRIELGLSSVNDTTLMRAG